MPVHFFLPHSCLSSHLSLSESGCSQQQSVVVLLRDSRTAPGRPPALGACCQAWGLIASGGIEILLPSGGIIVVGSYYLIIVCQYYLKNS